MLTLVSSAKGRSDASKTGYTVLTWFSGATQARWFAAQTRDAPAWTSVGSEDSVGDGAHNMKRVLFVGQEPETVDFSDPALPPGFDAEKIHAGIAVAMRQMAERGWQADLCLVRPDETAGFALDRQLASATYDCARLWATTA
jgi:hypothetical protein